LVNDYCLDNVNGISGRPREFKERRATREGHLIPAISLTFAAGGCRRA
jgi:hypothetical protein